MTSLWGHQLSFSSVQFSHSVMSDSLRPHESQRARLPCPSPTPGVYWNPCPSSRWCHPAISSSVVPFSSCPQSLPASGSFLMSQLFAWGGQSTGVSASASTKLVLYQIWLRLVMDIKLSYITDCIGFIRVKLYLKCRTHWVGHFILSHFTQLRCVVPIFVAW